MNIFVLNEDPIQAAKDQCDKHVVKMILETAQMLSTTQRWFYEDDYCNRVGYYKIAHINHPCTIWARTDASNYQWLYEHFVALCDEYTKRYGKVHLTDTKLRDKLSYIPGDMPSSYPNKTTPFAQAMPDEYKELARSQGLLNGSIPKLQIGLSNSRKWLYFRFTVFYYLYS
jgi:hypothetical protein